MALLVVWGFGEDVGQIVGCVALVFGIFFAYLVGFGKRKVRAISREITEAEGQVRALQDRV